MCVLQYLLPRHYKLNLFTPMYNDSGRGCPAPSEQGPGETRLPRNELEGALLLEAGLPVSGADKRVSGLKWGWIIELPFKPKHLSCCILYLWQHRSSFRPSLPGPINPGHVVYDSFLIPKERYYPPPGVDGALVTFRLLPPSARPAVPSEKGFLALVGKAFLERRKMMRNSVQPLYTTQQVWALYCCVGPG